MSNIFQGKDVPKIEFLNGDSTELPLPSGTSRDGLEIYDFEEVVLDEYYSETDELIQIGKKFVFVGNIKFSPITKIEYNKLLKAQNEPSFWFYPNKDLSAIKFKVKVVSLTAPYFAGLSGDAAIGYDVNFQLRGTKKLSKAGYGAVGIESGYGTNYGDNYGQ